MREVMMKAQALAEDIVASETYKTMHDLEEQVTKDENATALIAAYMEKRQSVELLLRSPNFEAEKVAAAGEELQNAEKAMEECTMVKDMREAQVKFQEMMDNVNRILRLVITGDVEDAQGGCTGNCASCGGCGQ
jgi:cell fate (sporulation/competence/biofilm development) regulator YlbF (YheA/YmcA/DUF963 family)